MLPPVKPENEPPAPSALNVIALRRGSVVQLSVSVRVENPCEVDRDVLCGIAEGTLDALLNHAPDFSVRSQGYRITRPRVRFKRRYSAGDRQRKRNIPESSAGGKTN